MQDTARTDIRSKAARLAGRLAGVIAAAAAAAASAVHGSGPGPVLQPVPVRVRRGRASDGR